MKKAFFVSIMLLVISFYAPPSFADAGIQEDENGKYITHYYPGQSAPTRLYLRTELLAQGYEVYGQPEQVLYASPPQEYDDQQGQWRYLGYTSRNVPFSNSNFRNDPGVFPPDEREYIENPWDSIGQCEKPNINPEDWDAIYAQIQAFAVAKGYDINAFPNDMKYYGFLTNSFNGNKGALRVFFYRRGYSNSNWRYETIENLILKYPDYSIEFKGNIPQQFTPGETLTLNLKFGQSVEYDFSFITAPIRVYLVYDGKQQQLYSKDLPYGANQSESAEISFTVPDTQSVTIKAVINAYELNGNFATAEHNYNNNTCQATLYRSAGLPQVPSEPSEPSQPSEPSEPSEPPTSFQNLSVTNLELLNANGQPVSGSVEVNKQYQVRATFNSTFNISGWATARFYVRRNSGMVFKGSKNIYFEPNSSTQITWDWTGMTEKVSLVATIDYRWWEQQNKWVEELFEGGEENTYSDNKMERNVAGTDMPGGPPTAITWGYPLYYHPMRMKEVITTVPVYGWKEVPIRGQTKYRIRTILTPPPDNY